MKNRDQLPFSYTNAQAPEYRFTDQESAAPLVRDIVSGDPRAYAHAPIVIIGSPQDEGVRRNDGRPGARFAPKEIRRQLFMMPAPRGMLATTVFDLGDILPGASLEESHRRQFEVIRSILQDGKLVIVLGGGNDISYPDCKALRSITRHVGVINVDSHLDVRDSARRNSGTAYRQLLEEELINPRSFWEVASKPELNADEHAHYLKRIGAHLYPLQVIRSLGVDDLFELILGRIGSHALFWGFDLDAVRQKDAPGVSAPHPEGLSAAEICRMAAIAGADRRSRILEISEVNPIHDVDNRTTGLAALVISHFWSSWVAGGSDQMPRIRPL